MAGWKPQHAESQEESIKKRNKLVTLMDGDAVASILVGLDRAGMYVYCICVQWYHVPYVHIPTYRSNFGLHLCCISLAYCYHIS